MATCFHFSPQFIALRTNLTPYVTLFSNFCLNTCLSRLQCGRQVELRVSYSEADRQRYETVLRLIGEQIGSTVDLEIIELPSKPDEPFAYNWRLRPRSPVYSFAEPALA